MWVGETWSQAKAKIPALPINSVWPWANALTFQCLHFLSYKFWLIVSHRVIVSIKWLGHVKHFKEYPKKVLNQDYYYCYWAWSPGFAGELGADVNLSLAMRTRLSKPFEILGATVPLSEMRVKTPVLSSSKVVVSLKWNMTGKCWVNWKVLSSIAVPGHRINTEVKNHQRAQLCSLALLPLWRGFTHRMLKLEGALELICLVLCFLYFFFSKKILPTKILL